MNNKIIIIHKISKILINYYQLMKMNNQRLYKKINKIKNQINNNYKKIIKKNKNIHRNNKKKKINKFKKKYYQYQNKINKTFKKKQKINKIYNNKMI